VSAPMANVRTGASGIKWFGGAIAAVLLAFSIFVATRSPASNAIEASPIVEHVAPAISGPTVAGGHFALRSYRGKFVLVNFFASWCASCAIEEPQLVRFSKSGIGKVLAVDFQDENGPARAFLSRYDASWPAVADPNGQIAIKWGVSAPPESFLISPSGVVLTKIVGPVTAKELRILVQVAKANGY
jgi:cytochrome c biogenesis protein CcmG/thiol:disulfide interchange protein DsbE